MDPDTRNAAPLRPSAAFGTVADDATSGAALAQLRAFVIKGGLRPGLLPAPERAAVLALVSAALPAAGTLREPEVNELLRTQLAGAVAGLDIDHVELRRWLVDAGWLQRDGYGRACWRTPAEALPEAVAVWGPAPAGPGPGRLGAGAGRCAPGCAPRPAPGLDRREARRRCGRMTAAIPERAGGV